jgi:large subunit ribosomal protein L35
MPKMKTNKAVAKRIKVTARGKLLRRRAGAGHLKSRKSPKQIRRFRKSAQLSRGFARIARRLMGM